MKIGTLRRSLIRIWFGINEASLRRHEIKPILVDLSPLSQCRRALVPNLREGGFSS